MHKILREDLRELHVRRLGRGARAPLAPPLASCLTTTGWYRFIGSALWYLHLQQYNLHTTTDYWGRRTNGCGHVRIWRRWFQWSCRVCERPVWFESRQDWLGINSKRLYFEGLDWDCCLEWREYYFSIEEYMDYSLLVSNSVITQQSSTRDIDILPRL